MWFFNKGTDLVVCGRCYWWLYTLNPHYHRKQVKYSKEYYQTHKENIKKSQYEYRRNNKDVVLAIQRRYRSKNPELFNSLRRAYQREWKRNIRMKLLLLLGNKCSNPNCLILGGCTDIRCLQFDHINGGGKKDHDLHGTRFCWYYLKHPDEATQKLQILCANCNWTKRYDSDTENNVKYK